MNRYNYPANMAGDIRAWLLEHPDTAKAAGKMKTREERSLYLQTILQEESEVTGGEGSSYGEDPVLLEELLCHNMQLFAKLCKENGIDMAELVLSGAVSCDTFMRTHLLAEAVSRFLDEDEKEAPKTTLFESVGDVNFYEDGILIRQDPDNKDGFYIIRCMPHSDDEERFQFGELYVDVSDNWIDKAAVASYGGLSGSTYPEAFAILCTDFYSWSNFGAESMGRAYDWQNTDRETIQSVLSQYKAAGMFPDKPWVDRLF